MKFLEHPGVQPLLHQSEQYNRLWEGMGQATVWVFTASPFCNTRSELRTLMHVALQNLTGDDDLRSDCDSHVITLDYGAAGEPLPPCLTFVVRTSYQAPEEVAETDTITVQIRQTTNRAVAEEMTALLSFV